MPKFHSPNSSSKKKLNFGAPFGRVPLNVAPQKLCHDFSFFKYFPILKILAFQLKQLKSFDFGDLFKVFPQCASPQILLCFASL